MPRSRVGTKNGWLALKGIARPLVRGGVDANIGDLCLPLGKEREAAARARRQNVSFPQGTLTPPGKPAASRGLQRAVLGRA